VTTQLARRPLIFRTHIAFAIACVGACAIAQVAVNMRVNTELRPSSQSPSSIRYAQDRQYSRMLNSEYRYEVRKSGALPSDLRAGYNAVGPLASDPMSYIPSKPSYATKQAGPPPPPKQLPPSAYSSQSIRYSSPAPPSASSGSIYKPLPPPTISGSLSSGSLNTGSVRYTR
jgi:hypothetical protein